MKNDYFISLIIRATTLSEIDIKRGRKTIVLKLFVLGDYDVITRGRNSIFFVVLQRLYFF